MSDIQELIKNADNFYYATEYDKAIELYEQVLDLDPDNELAQQRLRKAKLNKSLINVKPDDLSANALKSDMPKVVPPEALRLYKRTRSFIEAGDLPQAKKLLKQAIAISKNTGVDFLIARELLDNLPDAFTAEGYKKKAIEELDTQLWVKAMGDLNTASGLDQTDETTQILLAHLQRLIKAKNLLSQLNVGVNRKKRLRYLDEIQEIIELTNEVAVLSTLWQEVVRLFGEYNNKKKQDDSLIKNNVLGNFVWALLFSIMIMIAVSSSLYLLPRTRPTVDCSTINSLKVTLNYPKYIANGDDGEIYVTIENEGTTTISGSVLILFDGIGTDPFMDKPETKFENLAPSGSAPKATIHFSLNELFFPFSNPSQLDFNAIIMGNNKYCTSPDYYIATSPIYGLSKLLAFLWSTIGLTLVGLFWSQIKEWLLSTFKKKSG